MTSVWLHPKSDQGFCPSLEHSLGAVSFPLQRQWWMRRPGPRGQAGMSPHHPQLLRVWAAQAMGAARVRPCLKQSRLPSPDPGRVGTEGRPGLGRVPHDAVSLGRR